MEGAPPSERLLMQRILELDDEQLEVEEVDSDAPLSIDDDDDSDGNSSFEGRGDGGAGPHGGFTYDTSLACAHSYLGEVESIVSRRSFLDGGAILNLPMFYLEGIVLFPEATLPLRVIQPRFKAAVNLALTNDEAPNIIGVIHVRGRSQGEGIYLGSVGTTAEIRQVRHLEDGSINVVTRGQQRFRTRRPWTNADGAPCAEVQIIPEDLPLHIPRDAFGSLASVLNHESGKAQKLRQRTLKGDSESDMEELEEGTFESEEKEFSSQRGSASRYCNSDSSGSEEDEGTHGLWDGMGQEKRVSQYNNPEMQESSLGGSASYASLLNGKLSKRRGTGSGWGGAGSAWASDELKWSYRAQRTHWPHWVYRMYDAFHLARRAADMWTQMVDSPNLLDMVKKPEILSYYIASKIPVQDATRQELLDIDGVVSRLQKEIQLLESLDRIRCKNCMNVVARRVDMLVMSSDGPMGAYVNDAGYVHETLTLRNAHGLILQGRPETLHSWFPGYSWTIAVCGVCESHMGWLFKAVKRKLYPRQFWGLRRTQLAEKEVWSSR